MKGKDSGLYNYTSICIYDFNCKRYNFSSRLYNICKKKNRAGKYSIQIFIRELHNDLIKLKNEGRLNEVWTGNKLLVSGIGLRYIILSNVQTFTPRYK